ncbi:MAG: nucleoside deaminase [Cyclobacteriaceae bacterium]|jgi:tRNA(adenine34) deaminase
MMEEQHERFMKEALKEAQKAFDDGEVPVGAVMVCEGRIIARGWNQTEKLKDATAHAEMIAITSATAALGGKYLTGCTLYVTLEPCVMCAGALNWSQLPRLVYGASDVQRGFSVIADPLLHPKTEVIRGVLEQECAALIKAFFKKVRTN